MSGARKSNARSFAAFAVTATGACDLVWSAAQVVGTAAASASVINELRTIFAFLLNMLVSFAGLTADRRSLPTQPYGVIHSLFHMGQSKSYAPDTASLGKCGTDGGVLR